MANDITYNNIYQTPPSYPPPSVSTDILSETSLLVSAPPLEPVMSTNSNKKSCLFWVWITLSWVAIVVAVGYSFFMVLVADTNLSFFFNFETFSVLFVFVSMYMWYCVSLFLNPRNQIEQ